MPPHYTINIEWSDEDASFIATVPQLPGCMADGPTEEAALAEAKRSIQDWLETARAINRPIPLPPPTIESLARASALLNKSAVARLIGLEQRTECPYQKPYPLTPKEAERLQSALQDNNLALI